MVGWSCEGADGVRWGGGLFGVASQKISQSQAWGTFNGEADDFKQISSTYAFLISKRWKVYSCFRLIHTDF